MLRKTASILETQLSSSIGFRVLNKHEAFPFFSYLFNLEPWADHAALQMDSGLDRQIVRSPVAIERDHLRVGKRYVQMFTLMNNPEVSRPCQFSGVMTLDCDSVPMHDLAAEVSCQSPRGDLAAGEVHQFLQG